MTACEICLDGINAQKVLPRIHWIRSFVHVCSTGSFRKAAKEIGVTEGAVRQAVAALEKHVGEELFDRTATGKTPNMLGRFLLPTCQRAVFLLGCIA